MSGRKRRAVWLLLAAGTAWLDLWSKGLWKYPILETDGRVLNETWIEHWLYIEAIYNKGGVWSLPINQDILLVATALAVPLIIAWLFWPREVKWLESGAKALVLGGAVGNLWDRFEYPGVRDFIKVCFGEGNWCWPIFNVADIALVVGIILLILLSFFEKKPEEQPAP